MNDHVTDRHGVRVLECASDGDRVDNDRDAVDLIALALEHKAKLVVLPVPRLHGDFFTLSSRIAGEIVQKFVQYRLPVAIVGDISGHLDGSSALRAFVYEANRGNDIWFVHDKTELDDRLLRAQRNDNTG
ncbi:MAG TPA: DUF4180 domain-containing protein [Pseudonocardiaceae bacterium]|jgi:hypothetical protein|nr:DUF4180 domain-containing protein [Pseudonocardiaceae bacterium]